MNLDDYLLEHSGLPWRDLLEQWTWLLPSAFTVWFANRFGDLIIQTNDGAIHHLDTGAGTLTKVADTREQFCALCDDPDEANFYFMVPLVDELVALGRTLNPGECYSYHVAPAFEGSFETDNVVGRSLGEHYQIFGPQHKLTRDIPDGTAIEFVVGEPPR